MKTIVCSSDDDTGIFQGDSVAQFLLKIWQDYVLQMLLDLMKENGFTNKNKEIISNANYHLFVLYA